MKRHHSERLAMQHPSGAKLGWLRTTLLGGMLAISLAACTTTTNGPRHANWGQGQDIATASDASSNLQRAQIRYELAMGYFEQGKNTIALDEIKQVLALLPSSIDAWNLRGLIYMRLNEPTLAEESFRRSQSLDKANAIAANSLGLLLCSKQAYTEAYKQFRTAIAVGGLEVSRAYMNQGRCQMQAGDSAAAETSFRQSLERDPMNPVSGYHLASLYYNQGRHEQARFYIRRINNGEFASAETLWLGWQIERALHNTIGASQLAEQIRQRFGLSHEADLLEREAPND